MNQGLVVPLLIGVPGALSNQPPGPSSVPEEAASGDGVVAKSAGTWFCT